ncbi:unnamed protein product [Cylicostephanus goldi]|uniref:Uncharacterized protein n=1 Tax=Cylicostephanus goldi TaxID=71465 RepID=A0A3P7QQX3_CYLGO|nr:unnamed protein product [Cylicostephanus goldi]
MAWRSHHDGQIRVLGISASSREHGMLWKMERRSMHSRKIARQVAILTCSNLNYRFYFTQTLVQNWNMVANPMKPCAMEQW